MIRIRSLSALILLLGWSASIRAGDASLEEIFRNPPVTARPYV